MRNKIRINKNPAEIMVETFGKPSNECILLIMGATASMIWWDEKFCQRIAEKDFFVIRYDHRDTGESTCYPLGNLQYNMADLTDDAIAILDYYIIEKAHFAGMSLGGMIAQIAAIKYPQRVLSLTLISTSAWDNLPQLQHIDQKVIDYHSNAANINWEDLENLEKYLAGGWKILNGSKREYNEQRCRELVREDISRANSLVSMFNHNFLTGEENLYGRYVTVNLPTIIIHGTEDPVLSFANAEHLHKTIKDSVLVPLEGAGHEINFTDWDTIIQLLEKARQLTKK